MYRKEKILAVIPARAGSKRLPGKNIRVFLGTPLIARTIQEAKKSRYVDSVIVSTDDKKKPHEHHKKHGWDNKTG
jgi:CMP-N-acetylneuraminic acid synthetase